MGQAFLQMHNRLAFVGLGERGGTAKIRSELGTRAIPLPLEPAHRLVRERRVGRSPLPLEPAEGRGREEKGAREEEVEAPTANQPAPAPWTPSAQLRPPIPRIQPLGPQIRSPPHESSCHRACRTAVRSSPRGNSRPEGRRARTSHHRIRPTSMRIRSS